MATAGVTITCPACGTITELSADEVSGAVHCPKCAALCGVPAMPPTRKLMRLRSTMVDEPDPGPPTVVAPIVPKKKWLNRTKEKAPDTHITEAMSGYVSQDKVSHTKTWIACAIVTVVLLGIQVFARSDMGLQTAVATAYIYAIPAMAAWLLWTSLENMQRTAVFVLMPVAWWVVQGMLQQLPVMAYFIIFTVFAFLSYLVEFLIRECKSEPFRAACMSFLITLGTQQFFLLSNPDFMAKSASFPDIMRLLNPTITAGHLLSALLHR